MKTIHVVSALCLSIAPWVAAQQLVAPSLAAQPTATSQPAVESAASEAPTSIPTSARSTPAESALPATTLLLKRDTVVKLRLDQELSANQSKKGDEAPFTVVDDVMADGRVVVPAGTVLKSSVSHASPARQNDNCTEKTSGEIEFRTPKLLFADGSHASLSQETAKQRRDNVTDNATMGVLVVVASPVWAPLLALYFAVSGTALAVEYIAHPEKFNSNDPVPAGGCRNTLEGQKLEKGRLYTYYVRSDLKLPATAFATAGGPQ